MDTQEETGWSEALLAGAPGEPSALQQLDENLAELAADLEARRAELKAKRDALAAETASLVAGIKAHEEQESALRAQISDHLFAVFGGPLNRHMPSHSLGRFTYAYSPKVLVENQEALVRLLDGLRVVSSEGESAALVSWQPTINLAALAALLRTQAGLTPAPVAVVGDLGYGGDEHDLEQRRAALERAFDAARLAFVGSGEWWATPAEQAGEELPVIARLSRYDDRASWSLRVNKVAPASQQDSAAALPARQERRRAKPLTERRKR